MAPLCPRGCATRRGITFAQGKQQLRVSTAPFLSRTLTTSTRQQRRCLHSGDKDDQHERHTTPFMVSRSSAIQNALKFLDLGPNDVFLDIGSGDGGVLEAAAFPPAGKNIPRCSVGVEVSSDLCRASRERLEQRGEAEQAASDDVSSGAETSVRRWGIVEGRFEDVLATYRCGDLEMMHVGTSSGEVFTEAEKSKLLLSVANKVYFFLDTGGVRRGWSEFFHFLIHQESSESKTKSSSFFFFPHPHGMDIHIMYRNLKVLLSCAKRRRPLHPLPQLVAPLLMKYLPAEAKVVSFDFPLSTVDMGTTRKNVAWDEGATRFQLKRQIPIGMMELYCYNVIGEPDG